MDLINEGLALLLGIGLGWLAAHLRYRRHQKAHARTMGALEDSLRSSEKRRRLLLERIKDRDSSLGSLRVLTSHHERIIDDLKDRLEGQMDVIRSLRASAYHRSGNLGMLTGLASEPAVEGSAQSTAGQRHPAERDEDVLENRLTPNGSQGEIRLPQTQPKKHRDEEK